MYTNILEQLEKAIALKERGLFIYTLTNFESWATIDVDFLLHGFSNFIEDVKSINGKIIETSTGNDFVSMIAKGFEEISHGDIRIAYC